MKCSRCGFENADGVKFCGECGAKLVEVTEKKLSKAYEGARKQITVFFADVKGSTSIIEKMDPEESRTVLKPILDIMFHAVHKFGGTIIKSAGDGIMALFGAPIAFEDHALRACHAGLLLQKMVKELNTPIAIRVGMNSGEVVVDVFNADLRQEYDAMGPVVSIAARMEQMAQPNMVQIAPDTYRQVQNIVNVHSLGKMPIKGISEPMEVYELLGVKQDFSRFIQMRTSRLSAFIGRKEEMGILEGALERTLHEHGQVVGIVGEPGQGKSRLIYEFLNVSGAKEFPNYACQCQTIFQSNPFFVIKQVVKALCKIGDNVSQSDQIKMALNGLEFMGGDLVKDKNIVFEILGLPIEDKDWKGFSAVYKRQEMIKGVVNLFHKMSLKSPFILLVEDMQWIDNDSLECFNQLIDSLGQYRILVLLSFRPEFHPEWKHKYFTLIPVQGLSAESFYSLATSILGKDPKVDELKHQVVERCKGNPFFLEETIRSLKDRGMLGGEYGNFVLLHPIEQMVLPKTVQAVLDSRVDLLKSEEKHVLKVSAVIGKIISVNLLKYVVEVDENSFDSILGVLTEKNFISKLQDFPEVIYSFNHDVILESIYSSLLKSQKKKLHLAVLNCLEEKFPSEDQEQLIVKANHAFKAELWDKAFTAYGNLQIITHKSSAPVESFEHAKKMSEAFHHIDHPSKDQLRTYFSSLNYKAVLLVWQGKFSEMVALFDETDDVMYKLNEPLCTAEYYSFMKMRAYLGIGNYEEALKWCSLAQKIIEETGIESDEIQYFIDTGHMNSYYYIAEFKKCIDACRKILSIWKNPLIRDVFGSPVWSAAQSYIVSSYDQLGEFKLSKEHEKEILEVCKNRTASVDLYIEQAAVATTNCHQGQYEQALKYINLSLENSFKLSVRIYNSELLAMKGFVLSLQGENEEARKCLEESYEISKRMNFAWKTCRGIRFLFEGFLNIGDIETSKEVLSKMFELGEERKQKGIEAFAWRLKAQLAIVEGAKNPKEIEGFLKKGMEHAEKLGMLPEVAHCYKIFGRLYKKLGHLTQSEEAYHQAKCLYEKMGVVVPEEIIKQESIK